MLIANSKFDRWVVCYVDCEGYPELQRDFERIFDNERSALIYKAGNSESNLKIFPIKTSTPFVNGSFDYHGFEWFEDGDIFDMEEDELRCVDEVDLQKEMQILDDVIKNKEDELNKLKTIRESYNC